MTPKQILESAIAFCTDIANAATVPGAFVMMATRTKRELEDLLLHFTMLDNEEILTDLVIPSRSSPTFGGPR